MAFEWVIRAPGEEELHDIVECSRYYRAISGKVRRFQSSRAAVRLEPVLGGFLTFISTIYFTVSEQSTNLDAH
jgi:hypothetical protein